MLDSTASSEPSFVIAAERGLLMVFSSLVTAKGSESRFTTKILDELSARRVWPWLEKAKRKASPRGNAADELVLVQMRVTKVSEGRTKASNRFRRVSCANLAFNHIKSFNVEELVITSCAKAYDGHLDK